MNLIRRLLILLLMLAAPGIALAQGTPDQAVKSFFQSVVAKDYATSWSLFSEASKQYFVSAVAKDAKMTDSSVRALFDKNDQRLQNGFWDSFRNSSKSEIIARSATYKVLDKNASMAHVACLMKGKKGATIVVKNEHGWKLAYFETFKANGASK